MSHGKAIVFCRYHLIKHKKDTYILHKYEIGQSYQILIDKLLTLLFFELLSSQLGNFGVLAKY